MNKIKTIAEKISLSTGFISGIIMTMMMILVVINVITRRFFNAPIFGSTEIVRYLMMVAASLALFNNEWHDGNPQMTFIIDFFKPKVKAAINTVCYFAGAAGMLYVTYYMVAQINYKRVNNIISEDLKWPIWVFVLFLSIGTILMTLCLLTKGLVYLESIRTGKPYDIEHDPIDGGKG